MMKRVSLYLLIVSICSINCELSFAQGAQDTITNYVNPFIGTLGDGNVFAGACLPHSFIKLGPDTKYNSGAAGYKKGWAVKGFSHLHITGMGGPMYGNIQLIPTTGKVESLNHFSPTSYENATPGFYSVYLEKYHTSAQLTSSRHVGFHKYIFPKSNNAHILVDVGATLYGKNPTEWGSSKPIGGQVNIDPSGNAVYGFGSYQGSRSAKKPWKVFSMQFLTLRLNPPGLGTTVPLPMQASLQEATKLVPSSIMIQRQGKIF